MDIWEVLHWNSVVCNKDINPKLSEIESIIKTKLEQKEIRFEIIQSDRVMMKIDRISGISHHRAHHRGRSFSARLVSLWFLFQSDT